MICGYLDKNHTINEVHKNVKIIKSYFGEDMEYLISKWNISWDNYELIHDTAFMATFLTDNALKLSMRNVNMSFHSLSDILYEWPTGNKHFFGGCGLLNSDGIKKPSFYALHLLGRLGDRIIKRGDNYIITEKGNELQILIYNYAYMNLEFCRGERESISDIDRYNFFDRVNNVNLQIHFNGLQGSFRCVHYLLNRNYGSVYDEWIRMGAVNDMSREEIDYLKKISIPRIWVENLSSSTDLVLKASVPAHGMELITVNKKVF
jgi:beta-xylosidase